MKYRKGDKVRVKSLEWYNENKDASGDICSYKDDSTYYFINTMHLFCGKEAIITSVNSLYYEIDVDHGEYAWTDGMLEECFSESRPISSRRKPFIKLRRVGRR